MDHDDEELMEELFLSLVHNYDGSDTDSEDEDFLNFMGYVYLQSACLNTCFISRMGSAVAQW